MMEEDSVTSRSRAVSSFHAPKNLLSEFSLYTQDTRFILKPNRPDAECLVIGRLDGIIKSLPLSGIGLDSQHAQDFIQCFGLLGIIQLISGKFMILITGRKKIGSIRGKEVYKVLTHKVLQIPIDDSQLSDEEYDITHSAERRARFLVPELSSIPLWQRADARFFWNRHLLEELINLNLNHWILPVMDGFVTILPETSINDVKFTYVLISRRSCFRTGARYHMRGADPQGYVANFVETEQIIEYSGIISSFVQTRGSIPIIWWQTAKSLNLKPKPLLDFTFFTRIAFRRHFEEQLRLYKKQSIISLIDKNGREADLGAQYEIQYRLFANPDLSYYAYDFHDICKKTWDNLSVIVDGVKNQLKSFQYFLMDPKEQILLNQTGTFRTNCVDCLDRTNVVQSLLARHMLNIQASNIGILSSEDLIKNHPSFETFFKNIWADNADALSEAYTGTGALKTDLTRTGVRSLKGAAADGMNSIRRYVKQTFQDDEKQAYIDLFLGKILIAKLNFVASGSGSFVREVQTQTPTGNVRALLELDINSLNINIYIPESSQKKQYAFSSLKKLEKSFTNDKLLRLIFGVSNKGEEIEFASGLERETMMKFLYDNQRFLQCLKHSSILCRSEDSEFKSFGMSWNMKGISKAPSIEELTKIIPKSYDLYIIAVQDCNYEVPSGYESFSWSTHHLMFLLQSLFGEEYDLISAVSTNPSSTSKSKPKSTSCSTDTFAFARQSISGKLSNVFGVKVQQKPSVSSSKLFSMISDAKDKFRERFVTDETSTALVVGTAIHLRIHDQSLCFLNVRQDKSASGSLFLKNNENLNDFHHIICLGTIQKKSLNESWQQMAGFTNKEGPYESSLLIRSLPDMLKPLKVQSSSNLMSNGNTAIGVSIGFEVTHPPPLNQTMTISLSNLRLDVVNDKSGGKSDFLLKFGAHFTEGLLTPPIPLMSGSDRRSSAVDQKRASQKKDPILRVAPGPFEFGTFLSDENYLKHHFLRVELLTREGGRESYSIGAGTIALHLGFNKENRSPFFCPITFDDEQKANLSGNIEIISKS